MKEASFSLAEAKFAMGDFNHLVLQNVSKAQLKVKSKKDNVAGFYVTFVSCVQLSHCCRVCYLGFLLFFFHFQISSKLILIIFYLYSF